MPYALHAKVADSIAGGLTIGPQGLQGEQGLKDQGNKVTRALKEFKGNKAIRGPRNSRGTRWGPQGIRRPRTQGPPGLDIPGSSGQTIRHNGTD